MLRREEIAAKVAELDVLRKKWDRSETVTRDTPLWPEIRAGFEALGQMTRTSDVEPAAYELVCEIDILMERYDDWYSAWNADRLVESQGGDPTRHLRAGGSLELWSQFEKVVKVAPGHRRDYPAPAMLLLDQGCSRDVVCRKYRFTDDEGGKNKYVKLQEHLLAERNNAPSPHYDPADFCSEKDEQYERKWAEKFAGRAAKLEARGLKLAGKKKASVPRPPRDIDELAHEPYMTLTTLARKLGISEHEAEQQLASRGIVLDGSGARFFDPSVKGIDQRNREAGEKAELEHVETFDTLGDDADGVKARIQRMVADGRKPNTIAKALTYRLAKAGKPAVTYQQVKRVIDQAKEAAAA